MNFSTLLAQNEVLNDLGPILRAVLFCLVVACCLVITITTLLQSNDNEEGMESVIGGQESYYSKNKGSSRDGKLKIITIVMSCIAVVCTIVYFLTFLINYAE